MTDQAARIEQHTIFPIPAGERHGRARDLFTVWFGSNIMILTIVTGALATVQFQLSLIAAVGAILIGNLVGGVFMALHAAQGPQLGVPQMVQSRGQVGSHGAIFVVALGGDGVPAAIGQRGGLPSSGFLGMISVGALWQIAYAPYVSDYSRYMPADS